MKVTYKIKKDKDNSNTAGGIWTLEKERTVFEF